MARGLSCPTACGILVPRPGIEPMSPALEGGSSTTGPPGKSLKQLSFIVAVTQQMRSIGNDSLKMLNE